MRARRLRRRAAADGALLQGGAVQPVLLRKSIDTARKTCEPQPARSVRCGAKYVIKNGSAEYAFNARDDADFICTKPADLKFTQNFAAKMKFLAKISAIYYKITRGKDIHGFKISKQIL